MLTIQEKIKNSVISIITDEGKKKRKKKKKGFLSLMPNKI